MFFFCCFLSIYPPFLFGVTNVLVSLSWQAVAVAGIQETEQNFLSLAINFYRSKVQIMVVRDSNFIIESSESYYRFIHTIFWLYVFVKYHNGKLIFVVCAIVTLS